MQEMSQVSANQERNAPNLRMQVRFHDNSFKMQMQVFVTTWNSNYHAENASLVNYLVDASVAFGTTEEW